MYGEEGRDFSGVLEIVNGEVKVNARGCYGVYYGISINDDWMYGNIEADN